MSEVEKLVRSINSYFKNQNVVYELMDEAKIDIYKIKGMNNALSNSQGTAAISNRIQAANLIKNFNNALVMDTADEYEQKQMAFAGLSDLLKQIREGIASDLKMPVTKLFGISSAGFNSGEDDIENYNSMIESEIRAKVKFVLMDIIDLVCINLFGVEADDLRISFPELRMLKSDEAELVKNHQFNRAIQMYQVGLISADEMREAVNKAQLLPITVDKDAPVGDIIDMNLAETE